MTLFVVKIAPKQRSIHEKFLGIVEDLSYKGEYAPFIQSIIGHQPEQSIIRHQPVHSLPTSSIRHQTSPHCKLSVHTDRVSSAKLIQANE